MFFGAFEFDHRNTRSKSLIQIEQPNIQLCEWPTHWFLLFRQSAQKYSRFENRQFWRRFPKNFTDRNFYSAGLDFQGCILLGWKNKRDDEWEILPQSSSPVRTILRKQANKYLERLTHQFRTYTLLNYGISRLMVTPHHTKKVKNHHHYLSRHSHLLSLVV